MIYITYISNDRDYKGVILLNYMLKKYNSKYKLGCIVLENVSNDIKTKLKLLGILLYEYNLSDILKKYEIVGDYNSFLVNKHYYGKFLIFSLVEHKKIVYLDTDLLIKENIDNLFHYDVDNKLYMTYDILTDLDNNIKIYKNKFNSGVIVTETSQQICDYCYNELKKYENNIQELTSDQAILNKLNEKKIINVKYLDFRYNYIPIISNVFKKDPNPIIIHFILRPKPWDFVDLHNTIISDKIYSNPIKYFNEWIIIYNELIIEYMHQSHANIYKQFNKMFLIDDGTMEEITEL